VLDLPTHRPGSAVGWDVAGVVETAAANGSGPPAGARAVGFVEGWGSAPAELTLAAPIDALIERLPVAHQNS
jgi:NADPH:quinone reductase